MKGASVRLTNGSPGSRVAGEPAVDKEFRDLEISGLTPAGCRLTADPTLFVLGQAVAVQPRGLAAIEARIAWISGGKIGVEFVRPLDAAQLARLALEERVSMATRIWTNRR